MYLQEMRLDNTALSYISGYLNDIRSRGEEGPDIAASLEADMIECFTTEAGLKVLKLFEKAVLLSAPKANAPDSALREMNAVRSFVLEIRRIVANG